MARTRSEETQKKILDAAQTVLGDTGLEGFTVEEVARRSGVAKTTIYRHFPSGSQLMMATLDDTVQSFPTPNTGSLRGDLEAFMTDVLPIVGEPHITQAILGVAAAAATDPEIADIRTAMMAERMGPILTIIDLAKARGELPHDLNIDIALDLIEGPFLIRRLIRNETIDQLTIRQLVAFIAAGLTATTN